MSWQENYEKWRGSDCLNEEEKRELESVSGDEKELESRFCGQLSFGTAGLRGIMGVGLNRMNIHVIRHATQAFAEVILESGQEAAQKGIAVCFDCRNNSRDFAREAACVMAANGISVRLFESMRPTPELSFAVREYGCAAGLNITASHNPKEYNGYKVYWSDGAQLPPEPASRIAGKMEALDVFTAPRTMPYEKAEAEGKITLMGKETDEKFLSRVMALANDRETVEKVADRFKMVYTPFHGTGRELIPETLRRLGMKHVLCVKEQMVPDGNFSTVKSPNPENPEGFALAVKLAKENGADFILGSDPDADRVGIMVRTGSGEYEVLSGNQTGVLVLDYLIGAMKRAGKLPEKAATLKSIVTTEMARTVAERNGIPCYDTFTGFKYLAEKKNRLEDAGEGKVFMAYEESFGYMFGDHVRDKDAVSAALLLTEMAAWYFDQGMTLYDALMALYEKYGWYREKTINVVMPGLDGLARMGAMMEALRAEPPKEIGGEEIVTIRDYRDGTELDVVSGKKTAMELRDSNVLAYIRKDGMKVLARPSGTEPKIKFYLLAQGNSEEDCEKKLTLCHEWVQRVIQE